jgi:hypothetical protein
MAREQETGPHPARARTGEVGANERELRVLGQSPDDLAAEVGEVVGAVRGLSFPG